MRIAARPQALSADPRITLPSIATTSPPVVAICTICTQDSKACCTCVGSRAAKTREKVLREGAPRVAGPESGATRAAWPRQTLRPIPNEQRRR